MHILTLYIIFIVILQIYYIDILFYLEKISCIPNLCKSTSLLRKGFTSSHNSNKVNIIAAKILTYFAICNVGCFYILHITISCFV